MKITRCKLTGRWMASLIMRDGTDLVGHAPTLPLAMTRIAEMIAEHTKGMAA